MAVTPESLLRLATRPTTLWSAGIGLAAAGLAWAAWLVAPALVTSLDWAAYDHWLQTRHPPATTNSVVVVYHDPASPSPWEAGSVDRTALARMVRALDSEGARAIGLLAALEQPSPIDRGGAESDAMLVDAIRSSEHVVVPISFEAPPKKKKGAGGPARTLARAFVGAAHLVVRTDADGLVRRVSPVMVGQGRRLAAFGLAVAGARPAPEASAPALIDYVGLDPAAAFFSIPFTRLWHAIETGQHEQMRQWVEGKAVVLLLPGPLSDYATPVGPETPQAVIQLSLLNSVLTGHWTREAPAVTVVPLVLLLSGVAAFALFWKPGWSGLVGMLLVGAAYAGFVFLALPVAGLVLPLFTPLLALGLASGAALSWTYLRASPQIRELQHERDLVRHDLMAARDALVSQESVVEGLEEDLGEAKSALSRSAERESELIRSAQVLQAQCEDAHEKEVAARRRVDELRVRLNDLQAVTAEPEHGRHPGREQLHDQCERLGITTQSPRVLALIADVRKVAKSLLPVLILGEPGTGKEVFARAVHELSPRAPRSFVAVNMAAISPELFESELFGHVKGSFTGAVADRKGYFEMAHQGTIFLDEIGDLPYELQGKLLRVLQEKTFYRVGAAQPTKVDVRVVAATNKHLQREVTAGLFREDLFFRLQGHALRLPPLRERREDVPLLARRFLQEAAREAGREGLGLSREALSLLECQFWRGNVRELQQCLRQAVALAEGKVITKEDLRLEVPAGSEEGRMTVHRDPLIDPAGDQAVLTCLREYEFDMQATARALGWDRSTVTQRLKGLGFRALVDARGDLAKAAAVLAGDPALAHRVEGKLQIYYQHLLRSIEPHGSIEAAISASRKRFKNLPDRHFKAVRLLVQQYFERSASHHHAGHL